MAINNPERGNSIEILPEQAVEKIVLWWEDGRKRQAIYRMEGAPIWFRHWSEVGHLDLEGGLQGDQMHGPHRSYYDNGRLDHESFFVQGKEHGIAHQYDYEGNLIGTYGMEHGTGLDLWYQEAGILSEERQYTDGALHGFERWYWGFDRGNALSSEGHFKEQEKHGIFREWNSKGGLSRGFPQYFVNGERVTKRRYLTACKRDTSLPIFRTEDNDFHREPLER